MRRREGFTLLEVMVAVFILGTAMGMLLEYLGDHLARLADARRELEGAQLAAERLRELQSEVEAGVYPEPGRSEGQFETPHDYLRWRLDVELGSLPRPPEWTEGPPPSSVFAQPDLATGAPGTEPSLLRVTLWVFSEEVEDPESTSPYVVYLVKPIDEALLHQIAPEEPPEPGEEEEAAS